ncbi:Uncharacterised protein [Vibrio cholerae]|nr:Uncharacterised protein [Vibrio cholerae]
MAILEPVLFTLLKKCSSVTIHSRLTLTMCWGFYLWCFGHLS